MKRIALVLAVLFCFHLFHHRGHKSACACGGAVGVASVGYGGCGMAYAQPVAVAFAAPMVYAQPVVAFQSVAVATPFVQVNAVDNRRTVVRTITVVRTR